MKKEILITILVTSVMSVGLIFSLMQIYASPDENSYPYNASLIYLGTSIFVFTFLVTLKQNISIIIKWINILVVLIFGILAMLLALICLYAPPIENQVYSLASAIFVLSGMISLSGIFLISKLVVKIPNQTLEINS